MSNSPLVSYTRLTKNCSHPRNHAIDTVTIHCIVGQWTAKQGCDYFADTKRQASANYVVGRDGTIGLCVDEGDRAWTSGGKLTAGGMTGSTNDHRAITIEVASDTTHPYAITQAAMDALIDLLTDICRRNPGIHRLRWKGDKTLVGQVDKQNMTVHRWFAAKACPGDYLYNRHGEIAAEVNRRLDEEEREMEKELVLDLVRQELDKREAERYYATLQDIPESYRPSVEKLMKARILTGYNGGADGKVATYEDNYIRLDEEACRIITILDRAGAFNGMAAKGE